MYICLNVDSIKNIELLQHCEKKCNLALVAGDIVHRPFHEIFDMVDVRQCGTKRLVRQVAEISQIDKHCIPNAEIVFRLLQQMAHS